METSHLTAATQTEDGRVLRSAVSPGSLTRLDWGLLAVLGLLWAWCVVHTMRWGAVPVEDAAMLLRYSEHLAQGHGITWNVGEHPVDGATDFLFMAAIAMIGKVSGLSVIAASRILDLGAQLFAMLLLYAGPRRLFRCNPALPLAGSLYLLAGPGIKMSAACFGAPFFAAAALCAWYFANAYIERDAGWRNALAFALVGLLTGLVRPEGVFFAIFMLLAIVYAKGFQESRAAVLCFSAIFLVLGGGYFLWHWRYFGHPLPNPFYRKGDGHLYVYSLRQSIVNVAVMLAPVVPLLPLGFCTRKTACRSLTLFIPLALFTCMWVLLSNDNNHFKRFQYPIVPIVLFSLPGLLQGLPAALNLPGWNTLASKFKVIYATATLLAVVCSMFYIDREFPFFPATGAGMKEFALRLRPYADKGYTIALTEAGLLPLYSHWRVIDALGLNDAWIVHHGVTITGEYLDRYKPEIIMVHADGGGFSNAEFYAVLYGGDLGPTNVLRDFAELSQYARQRNYLLAAAYGSSVCNLHLYYVRRDFPDSDAIMAIIRDHPYYFLDNGALAHDFRNELPPKDQPGFVCALQ